MAKKMPSMNDQKPLLWVSILFSHLLMPWSCSWWWRPVKRSRMPQIIIKAANNGSPQWLRRCLMPSVCAPMINGMARSVYVASFPSTNISPLESTLRRLLISLSIYPMAAILVKSVQGSRIIRKPNNKDVRIMVLSSVV